VLDLANLHPGRKEHRTVCQLKHLGRRDR
jgi:hypothetical protein